MIPKNLLKDYTILQNISINILKQIINHTLLTINKIPQDKHNNFCNNNFFVTLQIEPQKISKRKDTRYKKNVAKVFDLYIYIYIFGDLPDPPTVRPY